MPNNLEVVQNKFELLNTISIEFQEEVNDALTIDNLNIVYEQFLNYLDSIRLDTPENDFESIIEELDRIYQETKDHIENNPNILETNEELLNYQAIYLNLIKEEFNRNFSSIDDLKTTEARCMQIVTGNEKLSRPNKLTLFRQIQVHYFDQLRKVTHSDLN